MSAMRTPAGRTALAGLCAALAGICVLLAPAGPALAQLDETCTVSILNRTAPVDALGGFVVPNVPFEEGIRSRVRATCVRNGQLVQGQSALLDLSADVNDIDVRFDRFQPLATRLEVAAINDVAVVEEADTVIEMAALATLPDGRVVTVTPADAGTFWSSSDPRVASIDADGVVTVHSRGVAVIRAQLEGLIASYRLEVAIPEDRDGDGLPDSYEIQNGLDPDDPSDALVDNDLDGLDNVQEYAAGTSPTIADTDGDGLLDGDEVDGGTNAVQADTDGDGLLDGEERRIGTDPTLADSDGDGLSDGAEIELDTDPRSADPTTRVVGQVVGPDGGVVAGAVVFVERSFQAVSGVDGTFVIEHVLVERPVIRASARFIADGVVLDGKSGRIAPVARGTTDLGTVRLRAVVGAVGGTVLSPRGAPVPDARVMVTVGDDERAVNANAAGQYLLQRFDEGAVTVIATDPRTGLRGRAFDQLEADASVQLDVRLSASGTLQGAVIGRDGTAVGPGVTVLLRGPQNLSTTTDDFSRYRFDFIPLGVYTVEAFDDAGNRGRTSGAINGTNQVVEADVTFLGKGRVAGIVETGGGALVRNAQVSLVGRGPFGGAAQAVTDERGAFVIDDVFVGPVELSAVEEATGLAGTGSGRIDFEGDEERVTITLRGAGQIVGVVLASDGETLVSGARLTVSPGGRRGISAEDGTFRFEGLPLGRYRIDAEMPDSPDRGRIAIDLTEPDEDVRADVTLVGLGTVRLTVRDAGGEPAVNVRTTLDARGVFPQQRVAITDADGVVEIDEVLAGPFAVAALDPLTGLAGAVDSTLLADEVLSLELRLESAGSIAGIAFGPDGVSGVRNIRIRLTPSGRQTTTDAAGRFRFDVLPVAAGPYRIEAFDGVGTRRAVVNDIDLGAHGEVIERNLVLAGSGTVTGTVLGPDGEPVSGAAITVDSAVVGAPRRFAATDSDGSWLIDRVPQGRFTVSASLRGLRQAGQVGGAIDFDGQRVVVDVQMNENVIPPPPPAPAGQPQGARNDRLARLFDANDFDYAIHQDGSIRNGTRSVFRGDGGANSGGFLLMLRAAGAGDYSPFAGNGARLELGGRQLALPGTGPGGLTVTRKVYVPRDGYFVRYLEVFENPTDERIDVDVRVRSHFASTTEDRGGFRFTEPPRLVGSSSGDTFADIGIGENSDEYVLVDDRLDLDPFESANQPTVAHVIDGIGGPQRADDGGFLLSDDGTWGRFDAQWSAVAVPPGGRVVIMHFGVQQLDQFGANAAGRRLAQTPLEAIEGLAPEEAFALYNAESEGAAAVGELPTRDSQLVGRVLEGDGETGVPRARITWQSEHPLFRRIRRATAGDDGAYTIDARLGAAGNNVPIPRGPYRITANHPRTGVEAPRQVADFPAGDGPAEQDIVFDNTGLVVGTVRRADGNVVSSGDLYLAGPALEGLLRDATARVEIAVDGRYVVTGVPPGQYRLTAVVDIAGGSPLRGEGQTVVAAGQVAQVDIVLDPTGGVVGRVLDGGGNPAIEVPAGLRADGFRRDGRTDTGGRYAFLDVPEGELTVQATEPRTGIISRDIVRVEPDELAELDLQLVPIGAVEIIATYDDGRIAANAPVQVYRELLGDGFRAAGRTDGSGRMLLSNVPRGAFGVRVLNPQNTVFRAEEAGEIVLHDERVVLPMTIPVDQPPQVLVTAPADLTEALEGRAIALRADAIDDHEVRFVEFYNNGELIGTDRGAPFTVDFVVPQGEGGEILAITARAVDSGDNRTLSDPIRIVRRDDEQLPTVLITAPFDGAAFIEGTTVPFTANAADDVGIARVEFFADGELIATDVEAPYATELRVPRGFADGAPEPMIIRAQAIDRAGNRDSVERNVLVVPDQPPTLRILDAPDGPVVEGDPIRIIAAVDDDLGATVDLLIGEQVLQTRPNAPYRFELFAPLVDDLVDELVDEIVLTLRATDEAGQTDIEELIIEIIEDTPPECVFASPESEFNIIEGQAVDIVADCFDEVGIEQVEFFVDGARVGELTVPPYALETNMPGGEEGPVTLQVVATDTAGQQTTVERQVQRLADEVPPTGRITAPEAGSTITVGPSDIIIALARHGAAGDRIALDLDGDAIDDIGLEAQERVGRALLGLLDPEAIRVGVIDYGPRANTRLALTDDLDAAAAALAAYVGLFADGALDLGAAIEEGVSRLIRQPARRGAAPVIFLIATEGGAVDDFAIARATEAGVVVNTVHIGPGDDAVLRDIAERTGGAHTRITSADDLPDLRRTALFGAGVLVVTAEAEDDVSVEALELSVTAADGALDVAVVDDQAPFNVIVPLPELAGPTAVTLGGAVRDFGENRGPLEPVLITVLPSDTAPQLRAAQPAAGAEGDIVVLSGRFFDPIIAGNTVRFGDAIAPVLDASKLSLRVEVPAGAGSNLTVEAGGLRSAVLEFPLDNDGDGLTDDDERQRGLDPRNADTDGDGLDDGGEIAAGTDPTVADTDEDGLLDGFEVAGGLDPLVGGDGALDPDGDGLDNAAEQAAGTAPRAPDTDGDGLNDGAEVLETNTDPTLADTDGGGIFDGDEVRDDGTDPTVAGDDVGRVAAPQVLRDGGGFDWDVEGDGRVERGSDDAFDGAIELRIDGQRYPDLGLMAPQLAGRQLRLGPANLGDLQVRRKIYVPADERFARVMAIIDNPGGTVREVRVRLTGNFGSDASTLLLGTSVPDGQLDVADDWFATDDAVDGGGDPALSFVFSGPRAPVEPDVVRLQRDSYTLEYPVVVQPGERAIVMHFAVQSATGADALAQAARLVELPDAALVGLTDGERAAVVNFVARADADRDGLPDEDELALGTRPDLPDTDGDGLLDGFEVAAGFDPLVGGEQGLDGDGDGLDNLGEQAAGTDPTAPDTDGDGLTDGVEVNDLGSNPRSADTDLDGLEDGEEINVHGTDPTATDSDGDGLDDGDEVRFLGLDPADPDTDGDGMPDGYEFDQFFDPRDPADGAADPDADDLDNLGEFRAGSDPRVFDTDGDGLRDGEEVAIGTDPTAGDTDGGGRSDFDEVRTDGTDPLDAADDLVFVALPTTLTDGAGFDWDIAESGAVGDGTLDAFDIAFRLAGDIFFATDGGARLVDGGRTLILGPVEVGTVGGPVRITRQIFVPDDAGWIRYVDIFDNPNGAALNLSVALAGNLGTDGATAVVADSSGDGAVGDDDDWWVTDDGAGGSPAVALVVSDADAPVQPAARLFSDDDFEITWTVQLPARSAGALLHYGLQRDVAADAAPIAQSLVRLQGAALRGLDAATQALVLNRVMVPDSDGDDLRDDAELALGTDPADPDTDGDGLFDGFEVAAGFDPIGADEGDLDPDADGLTNVREQAAGTDPNVDDTDGDGLEDGAEVDVHGTDPLDADTDDGGLSDGEEVAGGTDPLDGGDDQGGGGLCQFTDNVFAVAPPGGQFAFDTVGQPTSGLSDLCFTGGAGQAVAAITVEVAAEVSMVIIDGDFDTSMALRSDCDDPGTEIDCNDDFIDVLSGLELELQPGQYFLVIDGFDDFEEGEGLLEVTYTPL